MKAVKKCFPQRPLWSISLENGRLSFGNAPEVPVPTAPSLHHALVLCLRDKDRDVAWEACLVLRRLAAHEEGWAALIGNRHTCDLLVDALRTAPMTATKVMNMYCAREDGRQTLISSGVCAALVDTLANMSAYASEHHDVNAVFNDEWFMKSMHQIIHVIYSLCTHPLANGRARLIQCGASSALAAADAVLKSSKFSNCLARIAHCLHIFKPRSYGLPEQEYPRDESP